MQTSIIRSVVLASSLALVAAIGLSLLVPELYGNWTKTLTITGTIETGNFTPTGLECEKQGYKDRQLTWSPVKGADGYHVYHSGPFSHGKFHLVGEVKAPAAKYNGLRSSYFRHDWYVASVFKSWESESSKVISVRCRPDITFPGPKKPHGSNHYSQRTVELTWEPAPGAVLYGVFRADESDGDYDELDTTSGTAYTDASVADGMTYYYLVVALDGDGNESDPSAVVVVSDTLPTPTPTPTPVPGDATPMPGDAPIPTGGQPATATPTPAAGACTSSECHAEVRLGNVTVVTGAIGKVDLRVQDIPEPGLGAWTIDVLYNSSLVTQAGCHPGQASSCNPEFASGIVRILGTSSGRTGSSTLASLYFRCEAIGASGLTIRIEVFQDSTTGARQEIDAAIEHGGITCIAPGGSTPTPTNTPTPSPTATATPTPTATPEPTATDTP